MGPPAPKPALDPQLEQIKRQAAADAESSLKSRLSVDTEDLLRRFGAANSFGGAGRSIGAVVPTLATFGRVKA